MFSIDYIVFEIWGYPLSLVELLGTLSGLVSVWLATRGNILTWATGIVNEFFFFLLFYQYRLYSDMLLQVFFFILTLYGWFQWRQREAGNEKPIRVLSGQWRLIGGMVLLLGTIGLGAVMGRIHLWLPGWFPEPAAYPWADAFTTVGSVMATFLLARKRLETWWLWIAVDVVAVVVYFLKDIRFVGLEYVVFLVLASWGLYNWTKIRRSYAA
jgi:nicotinamide mononucleotide transporter